MLLIRCFSYKRLSYSTIKILILTTLSNFIAKFKRSHKLILSKCQQLCTFNMHFLPFQDVDQLHLFLERLQQLSPLPFNFLVFLLQPVKVSPYLFVLTGLFKPGFSKLQLQFFNLLKSAVQLRLLTALVLRMLLDLDFATL